jgi:hypothetical protein
MKSGGTLSIWFFIGLSLLVNGVLIFGSGIYETISPPENKVVLYDLHASIWWGALLTVLGAVYTWRFAPSRTR